MTENLKLTVGSPAPEFTLNNQDGEPVSLKDFSGQKVIVYFYPAAMTPGCTTQACDFRDSLNDFREAGYQVLGISKDDPAKLKKFSERDQLNFPLLSDPDISVHKIWGTWGEKKLYGKVVEGVIRSTFVISETGEIALASYNVKATGHVAALKKKLGLAS